MGCKGEEWIEWRRIRLKLYRPKGKTMSH